MISAQLALTYIKAFRESARSRGKLPDAASDMEKLGEFFRQIPSAADFCKARHDDQNIPRRFVETAFDSLLGEPGRNLVHLALENGRLGLLPYLKAAWDHLEDMESLVVEVHMECATPPGDALVESVRSRMEARTASRVRITCTTVPELLGGYRILWQNRILDLSARGQLDALRQHLKSV